MRQNSQPKRKAALLGVGLDNKDGHKRITQAEKFAVVGGSEETHDRMTETLIKTCEDLKRKGRELEDAAPKEVADLLHKNTPR
ncbi:hypothetical protein [Cerasicoccus maritimus]|uniref:hypothetical protein n=1 Tax=Cerasicoccus maritimus TaxID=490089 RepID=UPI0028528346|nr:hypothetical protein [Cerasicoccus maritimus]